MKKSMVAALAAIGTATVGFADVSRTIDYNLYKVNILEQNSKAEQMKKECNEHEGARFSEVAMNYFMTVYTCRSAEGDLLSIYVPEQTVKVGGDAKAFEKKWGKR